MPGDQLAPVINELRDNYFSLPSIDILRQARVRLDMMHFIFEQQLWLKILYRRYIMIDSSPQLGFDFLIVREYRIRIPVADALDPLVRQRLNLNDCFEERICPVSVVGAGKANLVTKSVKAANIWLMESNSPDMFHGKRAEVIGGLSDQGTERNVGEDTVFSLSQFRGAFHPDSNNAFMYPNCLWVTGLLHILYNALEEAITSLPGYDDFIAKLRILDQLLSDRMLRR